MSAELTDDRISALISEPLQIADHETAAAIMDVLDAEIANIQAQIDTAMIQASIRPLSDERQAWMQRAAYAAAMRRQERHKVYQRDRELRGTKGAAITAKKRDPAVQIAKQQRLMDEAAARREKNAIRRAALQLDREKLESARSRNACFVEAARRLLPPDALQEINAEVERLRERRG